MKSKLLNYETQSLFFVMLFSDLKFTVYIYIYILEPFSLKTLFANLVISFL